MDNKVRNADLNAVDYMNGSSVVSSKTTFVDGNLKGALARNNGSFSQYDEIVFIKSMQRKIYEYQTERFEYSGLPDPLTKYRFERKLINNGSALFIKIGDLYTVVNYTALEFNIYEEPVMVQVVEPKSALNGRKFNLSKDLNVLLIRNNEYMQALFVESRRFINLMEKTLYQIEKNIHSSAPKGLINLKNSELAFQEDSENPEKESLEKIVNGADTFYVLKSKGIAEQGYGQNEEDVFIPIELTDQTDKLLKNYFFAKEQIKELLGAEINATSQKKERNVVDEVNEQGLATGSLQHAFNIRKIDIEKINKRLGLSIEINYQNDEREDMSGEQEGGEDE